MSVPTWFQAGRYCVSIEIHDNLTGQDVVSEGFNANYAGPVENALDRAGEAIRDTEARRPTDAALDATPLTPTEAPR